eukprot:708219-Rhodomonas_salina.2
MTLDHTPLNCARSPSLRLANITALRAKRAPITLAQLRKSNHHHCFTLLLSTARKPSLHVHNYGSLRSLRCGSVHAGSECHDSFRAFACSWFWIVDGSASRACHLRLPLALDVEGRGQRDRAGGRLSHLQSE